MLIKCATLVQTMYKNSIGRKCYFELNVDISISVGRSDSSLVVCLASLIDSLLVDSLVRILVGIIVRELGDSSGS